MPAPPFRTRRYSPWGKLDEFRNAFDRIVLTLIAQAEADPGLGERKDVLALLLRSRRDDGTPMPRLDICDELLALIGAGHETTASALSWAFERLRRHPDVLAELVREVDEGGSDFRRATILELLRVRARHRCDWPPGQCRRTSTSASGGFRTIAPYSCALPICTRIRKSSLTPDRFDPNRFRGTKPPAPAWLAFGGGARRCIGADFAIAEIDIVLRTVLQNFQIHTDAAADEKSYFRGVAYTPKLGGRVVVNRRNVAHYVDPADQPIARATARHPLQRR